MTVRFCSDGKAEDCAAKVFALNPESSKGYGLRGAIRHNRADPNGAARDYKKALVLDPNDPEIAYAMAGAQKILRARQEQGAGGAGTSP